MALRIAQMEQLGERVYVGTTQDITACMLRNFGVVFDPLTSEVTHAHYVSNHQSAHPG